MLLSVKLYKGQQYSALKKECRQHHRLFEDPHFPATNESLFYSKSPPGPIEWKRPQELCESPHLFVNGISSHDLHQGKLGNCWFVAACSCLALRDSLWQKVIPDWKKQDWDSKKPNSHAGIFHFRFWRFAEWIDVVIDDRLPTMNEKLLFCHSNSKEEFWSALLEKAYAKLSGCYEALDGGNTGDAIVDFTASVAETIDLQEINYAKDSVKRLKLFEKLLKVYNRGGLISCSIHLKSDSKLEPSKLQGLEISHSYSVTKVQKIRLGNTAEKLFMIKMRNPWGRGEWLGPWSDNSKEWQKVSKKERKAIGIEVKNDGEFWMAFEDWYKYITNVIVCRLINTSYLSIRKTWDEVILRGAWARHEDPLLSRAGGCTNFLDTFLKNPQYVFDVMKDEDEVLISLQQRDKRIHRKEGKGENLVIGFSIHKVELNREYRLHSLYQKVAGSIYINTRSVFLRTDLKKGRYAIIPTTYNPNLEGDFLLRIYTDVASGCRELTFEKPQVTCWNIVIRYPRIVTQLQLHHATDLPKQNSSGGANSYAVFKCEYRKIRTAVFEDTLNPQFDTQVIFYRRNPKLPIIIQIWNSNKLCDTLIGEVTVEESQDNPRSQQILQLQTKDRQENEMPSSITITVISSNNLGAL
ncbi:calpain-5-like [Carcharodon carcharias]|uniref:calpain-5-like n=1 Tax=Carcharodon carcharias TaxID=13397 RepID=UPI001B7E5D0F|nr:calpain-5-like [Carcharodon carcharias]XP_041052397.1 calpain-5-like [Carcharodon carcharias]